MKNISGSQGMVCNDLSKGPQCSVFQIQSWFKNIRRDLPSLQEYPAMLEKVPSVTASVAGSLFEGEGLRQQRKFHVEKVQKRSKKCKIC